MRPVDGMIHHDSASHMAVKRAECNGSSSKVVSRNGVAKIETYQSVRPAGCSREVDGM